MEGRTKRSVRNAGVAIAMHVISMGLAVIARTMFARFLTAEYLGLSGLFTNIISVLSLSELGIGNVIIIHLYKPLATGDEDQICRLMNFYRKAYTRIGIAVAVCGVALMPFLDKLVKCDGNIPHLKFYFLLFVLQSATSYFFSYKMSLLVASQQEYICSLVRQSFDLLMKLLQIVVLWLSRQYVAFLLVPIVTGLASNVLISCIVDKKFGFLKKNRNLHMDKAQTKGMLKNVSSMMLHKVGNTVIGSTDNILISSMIGIIYTGLYSNYILLMNMVTTLINMCFSAVSASIGDFNAKKTLQERKSLFDVMCFWGVWIYGMGAICFACLYQPTIQLWLGETYLLDFGVVLIMSVNFFANGLTRVPGTFSDVNELYVKTKFKPIVMATINLVTSVICLKLWGLIGVLVGTLISYLLIGLWVDPYFLYKDVFRIPIYTYFFSLTKYVVAVAVVGLMTYGVVQAVPLYLGKVLVAVLMSNGLIFLFFCKNPAFRFVLERVKNLLPQKA